MNLKASVFKYKDIELYHLVMIVRPKDKCFVSTIR